MRFRRKKVSRRHKAGMKGDWVVGADFNCVEPLPVHELCAGGTGGLFDIPLSFSLLDSQDLLEKEDSCTVVRVVGDMPMVCLYVNAANDVGFNIFLVTVREGIYLAGSDGTLPSGKVDELDPRLPGDFELDTWLWMRTRVFKFAQLNTGSTANAVVEWRSGADYAVGQNDHIDIRVKRRLKRGQELVYVAGGFHEVLAGAIPADSVSVRLQAHLRCYVKF